MFPSQMIKKGLTIERAKADAPLKQFLPDRQLGIISPGYTPHIACSDGDIR
jgi:hypothetical protein